MQEDVLFQMTNGLYVISTPDHRRHDSFSGSLVDAVSQIAINPYLMILSCMNNSYTKECIEHSGIFGVSILPHDISPYLIAHFGFQSSRNINKWQDIPHLFRNNLPFLTDSLGNIQAKVINTLHYPCNTLFIAEIQNTSDYNRGKPLTYTDYRTSLKPDVFEAWKNHQQEKNND